MKDTDIAKKVIVIGASAGGVSALQVLAAGLPADFPAPICVVTHIGRQESRLPSLLGKRGPLPAEHACDGAPLLNGHIYVAPPDYHLQISGGHLHLTRGPRENFARPAIDPLFRSAAEAYGPDAIGVILSGNLNDGVAGLYEIKRRGGIAVVQAPEEAQCPSMPRSALEHVEVDHLLPVADMPPLLARLAATASHAASPRKEATQMTDITMERPPALTCPECGGAVRRDELGTLIQYRCHIGHNFTGETMVAVQFNALEKSIETALRSLNERIEICRQMAERARDDVDKKERQDAWQTAMQQAQERADEMKRLLSSGWLAPEVE